MHNKKYMCVALAALVIGCTMALYYRGNIIFSFNSPAASLYASTVPIAKKQIKLFFWRRNSWKHENSELLVGSDIAAASAAIVNKWLTLLDEEGVMIKKVTVPAVLMGASGNELYLSFDRYPFDKESSAYEKWMWLEGLLKTLRENGITTARIYFTVQHKPLRDYHLDFSNPWPINGFTQK